MLKITVNSSFDPLRDGWALKQAMRAGITSGALRGLETVRKGTREATPASGNNSVPPGAVNTGHFLRSWAVARNNRGASIVNSSPYAAVVEYGRRPGKGVPIGPLAQWVLRKLGGKMGLNKLRKKGGVAGADRRLAAARAVAYVISAAIKKRGLKGRHILHRAAPELYRIAQHECLMAVRVALSGKLTIRKV